MMKNPWEEINLFDYEIPHEIGCSYAVAGNE